MQASAQRSAMRPAGARPRLVALRPSSQGKIMGSIARMSIIRRAEAEGAGAEGSLFELTKDNYWDYIKADDNKEKLIIVDCFTDWCGPCKMIYPDLVKYSAELGTKGTIVKFNCNKYNKELGVTLKIKVAPTFLLYRNGEKVGDMTGAKLDKLKSLVNSLQGDPLTSQDIVQVSWASSDQV